MRFLPADEEFRLRTLAALGSVFTRLLYVAGLRRHPGRYYHWGFVRSYGDRTAHRIIEKQHELLLTDVLRAPISSLWKEVLEESNAAPALRHLQQELRERDLRPSAAQPAEGEHLAAVVIAMEGLLAARLAGA